MASSGAGGGRVLVGTSGWAYPHWRGRFYPGDLPHRAELSYLAERTSAVEANAPFYRLQRPETYRSWREHTPDGFVVAVKGGRFITHLKKLRDVRGPLANFFASGVLALGPRLGPVLWQLPEALPFDEERLATFLDLLPRTTEAAAELAREHDARLEGRALVATEADVAMRHALEVRHASYVEHRDRLVALLAAHDVALVVADTAGVFPYLEEVSASFGYLRLHGDTELYASGYSAAALDRWAAKVRAWSGRDGGPARDVYVFFDNDGWAHAPHDAVGLIARLHQP